MNKPYPELLFSAQIEAKKEGADSLRRFSGIAYSGEPILNHPFWGDLIFDLSTMQIPARIPALLEHDRNARAGVIDAFSIDEDGLKVEGYLMDTPAGNAVAAESDAGFPWQMSVHIDPEKITEATNSTVNGRTIRKKITVFTGGNIREVSFTPTGADRHTSATVFSHQFAGVPPMSEEEIKALQDENAKLKSLIADMQSKIDEAMATDRAAKMSDATGEEVTAEEKKVLASMSAEAFAFALKSAAKKVPDQDPMLFSSQADKGKPNNDGAANAVLSSIKNTFKL